jgi:hypothetical protein
MNTQTAERAKPPRRASGNAKKFWYLVLDRYELDPQHVALLRGVVEQMTRAEQAAEILAAQGICVVDRYGNPKEHPMLAAERKARAEIRAGLYALNLQDAPAELWG